VAEELGETVELRTDNGSGEARVEAGIATAATTFVNKSAEKGQMGEKKDNNELSAWERCEHDETKKENNQRSRVWSS
jgi:hypothetical protein